MVYVLQNYLDFHLSMPEPSFANPCPASVSVAVSSLIPLSLRAGGVRWGAVFDPAGSNTIAEYLIRCGLQPTQPLCLYRPFRPAGREARAKFRCQKALFALSHTCATVTRPTAITSALSECLLPPLVALVVAYEAYSVALAIEQHLNGQIERQRTRGRGHYEPDWESDEYHSVASALQRLATNQVPPSGFAELLRDDCESPPPPSSAPDPSGQAVAQTAAAAAVRPLPPDSTETSDAAAALPASNKRPRLS